jgi:2-C-methyl-D-erythritol 4-phosphate cytidylyltransferase
VVPEAEIEDCRKNIVDRYDLNKVTKIVAGGRRRQDSVANGFHAIEGQCDVVCIHDGVRPFIAQHLIERAVRTAKNFGGSCVAVRVTDTIKQITDDGFIQRTPNRRYLYAAQTPQCFNYNLYADALAFAEKEHLEATDDCFLVESVGGRIVIVEGNYDNIKITNPNDLKIAETIQRSLKS